MTTPDPVFLATAVEIVLRSGEIQMSRRESGFSINKKGTIDLVTEVDLECERMCRAVLAERFPDHDILAEELSSGPAQVASAHYRWVFDPLDGTTNYAHGLPVFCASLALEIDGQAVAGAVYDPTRKELFTGERGAGAFLNGTRLQVSETGALLDALLVTGFPYDVHQKLQPLIAMFGAFLGQARAVRRLGSAALDLCYVAAGRFDGFWEHGLQAWDMAAGILLVKEAGGVITDMNGGEQMLTKGNVICANENLHPQLLKVLKSVKA